MSLEQELARERAISSALSMRADNRSSGSLPRALLDDLRAAQKHTGRVLICSFGQDPANLPLLSILFESVDVAHLDRGVLVYSRYRNGVLAAARTKAFYNGSDPVIAGDILDMIEELDGGDSRPNAIVLVAPEEAPGVAQDVVDVFGVPYLIVTRDAEYRYPMMRLFVSASAVVLAFPELRHEWRKRQIVPAERLDVDDPVQFADTIRSRLLSDEDLSSHQPADGSHQLLLVSYFAPPTTPVSVNRLRYWQTEIPELATTRGIPVEVTWLTATRQARGPGMLVVPDEGELRVSGPSFESIQELRLRRLDTLGASWTDHVKNWVEASSRGFDTVVLSGNPFHYFSLAGPMRKAWGCRVILDFRDPFAWNPRFNYSIEQRAFLMQLEQEMVEDADAIISVNDQCLTQIAPGVDRPRRIVANGFDERTVDRARGSADEMANPGAPYRVVYSGTVFGNLPLDKVLDAVPRERGRLVHFGRDYSDSKAVSSHPTGVSGGLLAYENLVVELARSDAGLIMTSGESSTQTSKLFDYIACDLDIIIVTDGEVRTGNLHEITKNLDRIFWVRNNPEDLGRFFDDYAPDKVDRPQRMEFSRRNQAESLLDLMFALERE